MLQSGQIFVFARDITERKQAEEKLRESEKKYRVVVEISPDGIAIASKGCHVFANQSLARIFGVPDPDDLLGKPVMDYIHPDYRKIVRERIENLIKGGAPAPLIEEKMIRADGTVIQTEVAAAPLEYQGERAILAIIRDITERKRLEEVLEKERQDLKLIIDSSPIKIFFKDKEGKYIRVNKVYAEALEMPEEYFLGKTVFDFYSLPIAQSMSADDQDVIQSGRPKLNIIEQYESPSGLRWVQTDKIPICEEHGMSIGLIGFAQDITECKRAEEALQESEERFRLAFENANTGMCLVDLDGNLTRVNNKMCKIFGYTKQELERMTVNDIAHPEDIDKSPAFIQKTLRGEIERGTFEKRYFHKKGHVVTCQVSSSLVRTANGLPLYFISHIHDITERKQAEENLRESEERYRSLLENSDDAILLTVPDGGILKANPSACRMFGRTEAEITRMGRNGVVDTTDPRLPIALEERKRTGKFRGELTFLRRDGQPFPGELTSVVFQGKGGQPRSSMIIRDITDRKRFEEMFLRINKAVESSSDAIGMSSAQGHHFYHNKAFTELFEYTPEELEAAGGGQAAYADKSVARKVFDTIMSGGSWSGEVEMISKSGRKFPVELRADAITDESGNIIGLVGVHTDITERKRTEDALRESEERYRTLVETSPDAISLLDLNLNIVMVNRPALALYGYESPEEVVGRSALNFIAPQDRPRAVKEIQQVLEKGSLANSEYTQLRKGDVLFPAELSASLILDGEKRPLAIICVTRDISIRKRSEEERTALEDQLRQSQKMEAIGQLAGGVAHDFNNLLTVIKGYCQLSLAEMKESTPIKDVLEVINKATEKAADLTRQLLAFSRRQIMEVRVLDLNALLQNLDKMLRRIIGEDIELVMLLGEDLGRVKADPGQIEQVVMNLAVNAKDAMSKGGKLIIETANRELDEAYARAHVAVTPGRYVMIAVSDTGAGMGPEVRDRVFEPFFTTKGKGRGTGLGLSMVYGIVKQSNGNIWVYSEPGKGTTFKIFLPRVDEPAEKLKVQETGEEFPRGSETILVVEDDKEVRNLAVRILKRQGYTVLDGSYGDQAFNVCRQHKGPIHLLLTDVVMPGMDGRALSESLSQLHPEMKVLYMSGYTDDAIVRHGVMAKGMNYIQKPFTVNGLTKKVREVLEQ
jgi:PAS domain S-box-containing protein